MKSKHAIVCGNVGAGKSTLVRNISKMKNVVTYLEPASDNPYLIDFYKDMKTNALNMEIFLNMNRAEQHLEVIGQMNTVDDTIFIQDRSIYENALFANVMYEDGNMTHNDYQLFLKHSKFMIDHLRTPDTIIYLKTDPEVAMARKNSRNRKGEGGIPLDYITKIHNQYVSWIDEMSDICEVITIDYNDITKADEILKSIYNTLTETE